MPIQVVIAPESIPGVNAGVSNAKINTPISTEFGNLKSAIQ